jgi:cell division control protein 7
VIHDDEPEIDMFAPKQDHVVEKYRDEGQGQHHDMEEDRYSDSSEEAVNATVQEDMEKFQETFKGIRHRYRLVKRIGEGNNHIRLSTCGTNSSAGTFSTVYKAEDLQYDFYDNSWDIDETESSKWASPPLKKRRAESGSTLEDFDRQRRKPKYVAIKKIYVTSSPSRILNELDLLNDLRGCNSVCPLITAFRCTDQVVAVLPYFRHTDFREYFREMTISDIQIYFRSLFSALAAVHEQGILHRDIKPTNFLYEPEKRRGVLVDFGLAEREGIDSKPCLCGESSCERRRRIQNSVTAVSGPSVGYPKNDLRPSRRANRAGTRGFRAPEVLFKCTEQTTKIDIWSAGVMLLTILSKRFPFFNSADDVEAMIEIATIFGTKRMKLAAFLHGTVFETSIPTIGPSGFSLEKIILWSTCRNELEGEISMLTTEEKGAVAFLERCLDLDPYKRISAEEALRHEFLTEPEEEDEMHLL